MKKSLLVLVIGAMLVIAGCASIMHGSLQTINVTSDPVGATVKVDGVEVGTTPVVKDLARKSEHVIVISMEGYEDYEIKIEKAVDGAFWGNLLFGGLIGMIIDASSGAMYRLTPEQVYAELENKGVAGLYKEGRLYVAVTMNPKPEWEKIGTMKRKMF